MKTSPPFFLVSFALCSSSVSADIWAEREALEQIKHEISAIETLIESAKMLSNPADRTTFDYSSLLDDMKKIQTGISQHLAVPMEPIVPSQVDAISQNYTRHAQ